MVHRLFYQIFYLMKTDRRLKFSLKSEQFFFYSSCSKILCEKFWKTKRFKQVHRISFILNYDHCPLNFLLHISFDILKFLPTYSCALLQTLSKLHKHEFLWFGRFVIQHQTSCMLLCIISLLHVIRKSSGYLDLFYAHSVHQITVCSLACNKLEISERKW
jgi:hypothetical protein